MIFAVYSYYMMDRIQGRLGSLQIMLMTQMLPTSSAATDLPNTGSKHRPVSMRPDSSKDNRLDDSFSA